MRNVMEHWHTGSLVDWCRGIAYQIEREHQDALNERIETICELNREIDQLRADIGTREEVIEASDVCVHDTWIPCSTCVFEGWGESFGCHDDGCGGFDEWLDTHAVI